jgi:hypothetical protein
VAIYVYRVISGLPLCASISEEVKYRSNQQRRPARRWNASACFLQHG